MSEVGKLIAELRVLVGFLGEKGQAGWWSSEFLSPSAQAFLAPIFVRSLFLAQYQGATAAASNVHDAAIGIGRIYHLFRLPIGLEQAASESLGDASFCQAAQNRLASREVALARLTELAGCLQDASAGPVLLGSMGDDLTSELKRGAAIYYAAFTSGCQTFPYMREVE